MSNLARQLQEQQQQQQQQQQHLPLAEPKRARARKFWLTPGEMVLGLTFTAMVGFGAVHMISNQSQIYSANKDIQEIQSSIKEQGKVNDDLKVQVSELSTYERIKAITDKLGLQFNDKNVKVVQQK